MSKNKKPRKKPSKASHLRRMFIGARMEFDGNEDNGQVCELANGKQLTVSMVDQLIRNEFCWDISITFEFKNEFGFVRGETKEFKIKEPCRFNALTSFADELGVKVGLEMPDGYVFHRNTWKARVIG